MIHDLNPWGAFRPIFVSDERFWEFSRVEQEAFECDLDNWILWDIFMLLPMTDPCAFQLATFGDSIRGTKGDYSNACYISLCCSESGERIGYLDNIPPGLPFYQWLPIQALMLYDLSP